MSNNCADTRAMVQLLNSDSEKYGQRDMWERRNKYAL